MTYYGIYKITNLANCKMYIGKHKTTNLDDGYMGSGILINRALKKYGVENFRKEWLMFCEDEEELNYMERVYVDQTWVDRSDTYNMTLGGIGGSPKGRNKGRKLSEEIKQKISVAMQGMNNPMYGKPISDKTKELISKAQKGHHWYNNGITQTKAFSCPEGFVRGRLSKMECK